MSFYSPSYSETVSTIVQSGSGEQLFLTIATNTFQEIQLFL